MPFFLMTATVLFTFHGKMRIDIWSIIREINWFWWKNPKQPTKCRTELNTFFLIGCRRQKKIVSVWKMKMYSGTMNSNDWQFDEIDVFIWIFVKHPECYSVCIIFLFPQNWKYIMQTIVRFDLKPVQSDFATLLPIDG